MAQPEQVLGVPGLVEAVRTVEQLDRGRIAVRAGAHDGDGHVAGDRPQQREGKHGHNQQHDDRLQGPAHDEDCQPSSFRVNPGVPGGPGTPAFYAWWPKRSPGDGYFTKYQFSGVRLSVVSCGKTPWRLVVISLSRYASLVELQYPPELAIEPHMNSVSPVGW